MYEDEVDVMVNSVLSGKHHDIELLSSLRDSDIPILAAFANDNDIQRIEICSTNIGFVRKYQKRFKRSEVKHGD